MTDSVLWIRDEEIREMSGYGPGSIDADYDGPMIAAVYLLRDDGAALLQLRDQKPGLRHAGVWVPPGGHMDPGEILEQTARREFEEETRIHCTSLQWSNAFEVVLPPWPTFLLANFWDRYDGAQAYECLEGQMLRFIERERAAELPMPAFVVKDWDHVLSQMHC
jgi:8-oxo-dGTP pyrophosphatase MutT (NUDIX family)